MSNTDSAPEEVLGDVSRGEKVVVPSYQTIAECDLFGMGLQGVKLVFTNDYEGKIPNVFRRWCQWFFIGTVWTFPKAGE